MTEAYMHQARGVILIDKIRNANSADKLRLRIKPRSTRSQPDDGASGGLNLAAHKEKEEESEEKQVFRACFAALQRTGCGCF